MSGALSGCTGNMCTWLRTMTRVGHSSILQWDEIRDGARRTFPNRRVRWDETLRPHQTVTDQEHSLIVTFGEVATSSADAVPEFRGLDG
jgi:hypothetical protein